MGSSQRQRRILLHSPWSVLSSFSAEERLKAALLSGWFFVVITTLWLLKAMRSASLLAHLGAAEIPYVRIGSVVVVAIVVAVYSHIVNRFTRLEVARGASVLFSAVLLLFWLALQLWGERLGAQRWFVWAIFILVDVYSVVIVGIFWTYCNDVMTRAEADKLYGPIGLGGIVGGIAGGALVDSLAHSLGQINLLLLCAGLGLVCAALVTMSERRLRPRPRVMEEKAAGLGSMLEGAREVLRSRYLMLIVGMVVGYEFVAAMTDFVVSVIFERNISGEANLAQMFGRLGWIVSITALVSQLVVVPALLHAKRIALLVPPVAMVVGMLGVSLLPIVSIAIFLSAADRGLNYSLQQVTKETLYVPLSDTQKYKAKSFIDMLVDRAGKALSALALLLVIALSGVSVLGPLAVAAVALVVWLVSAHYLGRAYVLKVGDSPQPPLRRRVRRSSVSHGPAVPGAAVPTDSSSPA